ncbi:hypothetical protein N7495_007781 [Penicillium taxi]|uniref:uncharacterized protein n=1 Tax=Penicillium taxi TaxID=168475 RepID=UPI002545862B|nr:uncharacterized protein N7495_007781 [Penicillium taxi]KAJ5887740.1 hypothetical protein N7495_007781 [Penicillium taxi]
MQEEKLYMSTMFKSWLRERNMVSPERMAEILDHTSTFFDYFNSPVPIPINSAFQKLPFKVGFRDRLKLNTSNELIDPGSLSPDIRHFRLKCRMIKEFMLRTSQKLKENGRVDGEVRHLLIILCDRIERLDLEPYGKEYEIKRRKEAEHPLHRSNREMEEGDEENGEAQSWMTIKLRKQRAQTQGSEVENTSALNQQEPAFSQSEVDVEMKRIMRQYAKSDEDGVFWKMVQERRHRKDLLYSKSEAEAEMSRICEKYAKRDENGNIKKTWMRVKREKEVEVKR